MTPSDEFESLATPLRAELIAYCEDDGTARAHAVQVLEITGGRISRIAIFLDPGLFATFGLPPVLHAATLAASPAGRAL